MSFSKAPTKSISTISKSGGAQSKPSQMKSGQSPRSPLGPDWKVPTTTKTIKGLK